ncbi:hypothetical protein GF359_00360 [candidate division WOR-3 bacterium]|uniref:DUF7793 domain-containing protein n=1 Tax=candidate division WOR-3 bacterium TaxID=2052148 RepID=A0A9D5QD24_UNCW3|nr:hypothetical protein [candidate division WOR-3 bacterium]MBD3363645.1 hypothetical protein [candidate division WOR-3 bacterium]
MSKQPAITTYEAESDVVRVKLTRQIDIENVDAYIDALNKALGKSKRKYQLIDASSLRHLVLDKETRRVLRDNEAGIKTNKIAYVGLSPVSRMMFRALHAVNQNEGPEYGFFYTEQEALAWLRKNIPIQSELLKGMIDASCKVNDET